MKTALVHLSNAWPERLTIEQLQSLVQDTLGAAASDQWPHELLTGYYGGAIRLDTEPAAFTNQVANRPQATRFARLQAERSGKATNLLHQSKTLDDVERQLLVGLDGVRDQEQLAELLSEDSGAANDETAPLISQRQTETIKGLSRLAEKAFLLNS